MYGLGASLYNRKAVAKVYSVKGRPADNPLIVHISKKEELQNLTRKLLPEANLLINKFWPGPLTLVCRRSKNVPKTVTAGLNTVAVRMPSHPVAQKLLRSLGEPIAAPSANRSGRPSPTRYKDVVQELGDAVDFILSGGHSRLGLESTVLDITRRPFTILRPGSVTLEELQTVVPEVQYYERKKIKGAVRSPGLKHRHYEPRCKVVLVASKDWDKTCEEWKKKKFKLGVYAFRQKIEKDKKIIFFRSFKGNKKAYAKHLYAAFFDAEKAGVEALLVEAISPKGVGRAIMDRLQRASGNG